MQLHASQDDLERALQLIEQGSFKPAHELCLQALARNENTAQAFYLLAIIAATHDNFGRAAQLLDKAIALDPTAARFHAQRARCLSRLRRGHEALRAAEAAAALGPKDALSLDTIGVVLSQAGLHEKAAPFFAEAAALQPENVNILHNLGVSLQFSGNFDGAEAAFRKELELRPAARRPYAALVNLRKQTNEQNFIPELDEQFAAAPDANARMQIGHALAKTYEDIGDYGQAMDWLARAKAQKRQDVGDVMPGFERIFAAAAESWRAQLRETGFPNEEAIFVVGMPRTGTTLVDRILSSHPDVVSAGELGSFAALAHAMASVAETDTAEMFVRASRLDAARLGELYIRSTRTITGGTPRFIDKMPVNFLNAGLIHRALPNARIICLRRDPMDACLSNYRQLFGADAAPYFYTLSLETTAHYYKLFDQLAARWREALPADRYMEVSYEALVADAETETRRMLSFCGLAWDESCLAFHENAAPVATASSVQVRSPIYSSSIGRWRRYGAALEPLRTALQAAGVSLSD